MTFIFYEINLYFTLLYFLGKIIDIKLFLWKRNKKYNKKYFLNYPSEKLFYKLNKDARYHLNNYFNDDFFKKYDTYEINYIKKILTTRFTDYYVFKFATKKMINNKTILYEPKNLKKIYYKTEYQTYKLNYINLLFYSIAFLIRGIIVLILSIKIKEAIESVDAIYLRKKFDKDLINLKTIDKTLKNSEIKFLPVFVPPTSKFNKKYNINTINSLKGFKKNFSLSLIKTFTQNFSLYNLYSSDFISNKHFYQRIKDQLLIMPIIYLKSKVYFGIFTDKAYFVLLHKYKLSFQKIISFADGFSFPPNHGADFFYTDTLLTINKYDAKTFNINDGIISNIIQMGNIRDQTTNDSSSISKDLIDKFKKYDFKVLITTTPCDDFNYAPVIFEKMYKFVNKVIEISKNVDNTIFIIKEKKSELTNYNIDKTNIENVFFVNSRNPKYIINNKFEVLLPECDLLISYTNNSMTLLQALSKNIPVIIIKEDNNETLWNNFENIESNLSSLEANIIFWLKMSKKNKIKKLDYITKELNLKENKSYDIICNEIISSINKPYE
tara:strand:- start:1517 stop:3172 length:1656 start_codon:yes stop_codon:yes gene_type:complete